MLRGAGPFDIRLSRLGAWTLTISAALPWFTSGAMTQTVLTGRSWIALLAGAIALWWSYAAPSRWRAAAPVVRAASAAIAFVAGATSLIVRPTALGPSIGVALCLIGAALVGAGAALSIQRERRAANPIVGSDTEGGPSVVDGSDPAIEPKQRVSSRRRIGRAGAVGALAVIGVLVVWPARPGDLGSRSEPTQSFDDALARYASATADEAGTVFEPCESRLMSHGERTAVSVVLFHGLTNCPKQFVEFGTQLHEEGANVLILRAPGHGIANDQGDAIGGLANVAGLTAADLRDYADEALDIGVGLGTEVRVLGLSMGGVISTWVAQERPDVERVVAVAPAMTIPGVPAFSTNLFRNIADKIPNVDLPGRSKLDHTYSGETTKGLNATFLMADFVADSAYDRGPAANDVVVVLNPDDDEVDPNHLQAFGDRWMTRGETVTIHRLPAQGLPHDVIDPDQPAGDTAVVYPILMDLLDGET